MLWRGLAQLAVGLTHAARGNRRGALALLGRGRDAIAPYRGAAPYAIDVTGLLDWASRCLDALTHDGDGPVPREPPRLRRP